MLPSLSSSLFLVLTNFSLTLSNTHIHIYKYIHSHTHTHTYIYIHTHTHSFGCSFKATPPSNREAGLLAMEVMFSPLVLLHILLKGSSPTQACKPQEASIHHYFHIPCSRIYHLLWNATPLVVTNATTVIPPAVAIQLRSPGHRPWL